MPLPKEFPSSAELQRVAQEHEYFRFYDSDILDPRGTSDRSKFRLKEFFENDSKKALLLDIALNVAPIIVDAGTDFTFGRLPMVQVEDGYQGQETIQAKIDDIVKRTRLMQRMRDSSTLFQTVGHAQLKLFQVDGKVQINEVPYNYWFPIYDGVPVDQETENIPIVAYLTKVDDGGRESKYIYVEDYYLVNKKLWIARSLWEDQGAKIGNQVPISTFPGLKAVGEADPNNPLTIIEKTQFEFLPFVRMDVRKNVMRRHGESVLKKVKPLLYEVNDRLTQISIQFLKHLNAKLQLPEGAVVRDPKTGKIHSVNLEVILARAGEPDAKYITNDNPLIEQAFEHLEKVLRKIAKLTHTPDTFLTEDEKGGVEKASTLRARLFLFISRIERYQQIYEEAILDAVRKALLIEGERDVDKIPLVVVFESSLPKDWEHDVAVWGEAKAMGLSSKETAVSRFQGIDGKELEEELGRIKEDEEAQQESMMKMIDAEGSDPDEE